MNVLILRPASFVENFYAVLGLIKHQKINGGAMAPDLEIPMIATRDIADVAARALKARDWTGVVVREPRISPARARLASFAMGVVF